MNIAIIGCGFVADYYLAALPSHPQLRVIGVFDRLRERTEVFSKAYGVNGYGKLEELLTDDRIQLVLNLTNPRDHYTLSKACLNSGKHVYSEKPLAMEMNEARELVALARTKQLLIASAPCSALGETAQTIWRALRNSAVGPVRLVYAEMDDGMVHRMRFRNWHSLSGMPWPYKDEFEVGCTLEHSGYFLTWLVTMFGPAVAVTTFSSVRIPDKAPGEPLNLESPDFTVACIELKSGVVARLTCSIVAPHDHSLRIIGDGGVIYTKEAWDYRSVVYRRRMLTIRRKTFLSPFRTRLRLPASPFRKLGSKRPHTMDFARGPAEMADAIREGRPCRISPELSLHVNELALAIHHAARDGCHYRMTTTFDPIEPMQWAV
jgi:predicted dehydrogenase